MENHTCLEYCNGFSCKKHYLIDENRMNEFYVLDEKYFVCYKCMKSGKFDTMHYRHYWKLPKNVEYKRKNIDYCKRNHQETRSDHPYLFEDLWYKKHYKKLDSYGKEHKGIVLDYQNYEKLIHANVLF